MNYSKEEIERFIKILKSVDKSPPKSNKVVCKNCQICNFFIDKLLRLLLL